MLDYNSPHRYDWEADDFHPGGFRSSFDRLAELQELVDRACIAARPLHHRNDLINEISRLLRATPYPEKWQHEDIQVAIKFYDRWQAEKKTRGPDTLNRFRKSFFIAADSMDMGGFRLHLEVSTFHEPWSEQAVLKGLFNTSAIIDTDVNPRKDRAYASVELNEADPIYTERSLAWEAAGAALHETTHCQQKIRIFRGIHAAYSDMDEQWGILEPLMKFRDVYRFSLVERQAHYREAVFTALVHAYELPDEATCSRQAVQQSRKPPEFRNRFE